LNNTFPITADEYIAILEENNTPIPEKIPEWYINQFGNHLKLANVPFLYTLIKTNKTYQVDIMYEKQILGDGSIVSQPVSIIVE
jgi:hypothetical protein